HRPGTVAGRAPAAGPAERDDHPARGRLARGGDPPAVRFRPGRPPRPPGVPAAAGCAHCRAPQSERMRPPLRTRADLVALADDLLAALAPYSSPAGAQITLPGTPGGYGTAADGLEGFARTFLLAAMRLAADPADPAGLAERYARGLTAGTDTSAVEAWVRPSEHGQAKVEAASLALALAWSREQVWAQLSP